MRTMLRIRIGSVGNGTLWRGIPMSFSLERFAMELMPPVGKCVLGIAGGWCAVPATFLFLTVRQCFADPCLTKSVATTKGHWSQKIRTYSQEWQSAGAC